MAMTTSGSRCGGEVILALAVGVVHIVSLWGWSGERNDT
jgi:hypothetical protein